MQKLSIFALSFLFSLHFAAAFEDTSPFFIVKKHKGEEKVLASTGNYVLTSDEFIEIAEKAVNTCDFDTLVIVSQPGLHSSDMISKSASPHTHKMLESWPQSFTVSNVNGRFSFERFARISAQTCDISSKNILNIDPLSPKFNATEYIKPINMIQSQQENDKQNDNENDNENKEKKNDSLQKKKISKYLFKISFPRLDKDENFRAQEIKKYDIILHEIISSIETENLAVIYTSSPVGSIDFIRQGKNKGVHLGDPKKVVIHKPPKNVKRAKMPQKYNNNNANSLASLFTKYQFFSPGVYMGIFAFLIVYALLTLAVRVLSSLSISYNSFTKEAGPQAKKPSQ